MIKKSIILSGLLAPFLITGCAQVSPKKTDISGFEKIEEYKDFHPKNISENEKQYKVRVNISAFGHIADSEKEAMKRAKNFCSQSSKKMIPVKEHIIKPPYMINHYPSVTLTFVCQDNKPKKAYEKVGSTKVESSSNFQKKYKDLIMLKKLLDDKIITQKEFEKEKSKILDR